MKKKMLKITSAMLMGVGVLFTTETDIYSGSEEEIFTVIHTNDMHGRMNEPNPKKDPNGTLLSRLKKYVDDYDPDLLVDGGDAIQGLPMANLNDGKYMIDAMIEIGYDAMAVGNHEFDFGYDNLMEIKDTLASEDNLSLLSSNVEKDGALSFKPYDVVTKAGRKVAIIGFTTPETQGKTHPNNTEGVRFLDVETQAKKYIDKILAENDDIDLILPVAHLGTDGETRDQDRGDILSQKIADYLKEEKSSEIPVLFVDGHSHTEEENTFGRDNLLYVQTGEHLNNIGHVEINFDDFTKSTAKLVSTKDIKGGPQLEAEKKAEDFFGDIAKEIILKNLPYHFNGQRQDVRTHETNLGNLVGDAMIAYGNGLKNKPDLAVMNGGGIREDLKAGEVNRADVISIIPFGNTYASIQVSGAVIKEMFEHAYRTPIQVDENNEYIKDELGYYLLEPNGGFLQVSGNVKIEYNPLKTPGNRIIKIMLEQPDGWEELQLDKNYTLATNDFLAQGGDGYDMLGGERIEGDSLDDVFARFLQSGNVNWDQYAKEYDPSRIIQLTEPIVDTDSEEAKAAAKDFDKLVASLPALSELRVEDRAKLLLVREAYEKLSDEAKAFVTSLAELEKLEERIVELEKEEELPPTPPVEKDPVADKEEKEEEEEEEEEIAGNEDKLPQTGEAETYSLLIGSSIISIGLTGLVGVNRKKLFN